MKKSMIMVLLGAFLAGTGVSHAANTITFNGEVVDTTCEPAVTDGDYTVTLDPVALSSLTTTGIYDGVTAPFAVQFINCPNTVTEVGVVLNSSGYDATTGNMTDVAGYGSDALQIQVMDGTSATTQVVVGDGTPVTYVTVDSNGSAIIPMTAHYYVKETTGLTTGIISTTATYAVRTQQFC